MILLFEFSFSFRFSAHYSENSPWSNYQLFLKCSQSAQICVFLLLILIYFNPILSLLRCLGPWFTSLPTVNLLVLQFHFLPKRFWSSGSSPCSDQVLLDVSIISPTNPSLPCDVASVREGCLGRSLVFSAGFSLTTKDFAWSYLSLSQWAVGSMAYLTLDTLQISASMKRAIDSTQIAVPCWDLDSF